MQIQLKAHKAAVTMIQEKADTDKQLMLDLQREKHQQALGMGLSEENRKFAGSNTDW